jgi:hypothetical protein
MFGAMKCRRGRAFFFFLLSIDTPPSLRVLSFHFAVAFEIYRKTMMLSNKFTGINSFRLSVPEYSAALSSGFRL